MKIRVAKDESDSKAASRIYAMGWKAGYRGIFSDELLDGIAPDRWVPGFNSNYETGRCQVVILSVDGEDVGAGAYGLSRDYDDPEVGEVTSIYFLAAAWGKGYAKRLMDFMLEGLREQGCRRAHVWVLRENARARRFYEKCGFGRSGNEKPVSINGEEKMNVEYAMGL